MRNNLSPWLYDSTVLQSTVDLLLSPRSQTFCDWITYLGPRLNDTDSHTRKVEVTYNGSTREVSFYMGKISIILYFIHVKY